jgi:uracil-DNA glycosylase
MLLLSFVENEILSEDFDLSLVWKEFLGLGPHEAASETKRSYWLTQKSLYSFLSMEYRKGKVIYPKQAAMFEAYRKTAPSEVKVVLLGQDPYHGPGQANGLSFSVSDGVSPPPSLKNIFKELASDIGIEEPTSGCLDLWAERGVLMINSILSVCEGEPGSHRNKGWEDLTQIVLSQLSQKRHGLVFILWGSYAQNQKRFIDSDRHLVIECAHPSPLSAWRGFFGSKPFSRTNEYLAMQGKLPIDWHI